MAKFTVRVTGTAPVWADLEIEADSAEEALEKIQNAEYDGDIAMDLSLWEFCEGGNGIDWDTTGDVYDEHGEEVLIDDGERVEVAR